MQVPMHFKQNTVSYVVNIKKLVLNVTWRGKIPHKNPGKKKKKKTLRGVSALKTYYKAKLVKL